MISSSLTSWALLVWRTLSELGLDPAMVFQASGADISKLGDGQARYDIKVMNRLWGNAVESSGDPDFGIKAGDRWCPTTFHALGFSWLASTSLYDGFSRVSRYAGLVNTSIKIHFQPEGRFYRFEIRSSSFEQKYIHPAAMDAGIASALKMCRMLAGENFSPVEVSLTRGFHPPGAMDSYSGCEVQYSASRDSILFDAMLAKAELSSGNPALASVNAHAAADYLQRIERDNTLGLVRAEITKLLPQGGINEEYVAKHLNLTLRTLQRKLGDQGMSFRQLVNSTRQELAMDYIRNSQLSLTEISYLLGFADQANFTRAFKRWTGHTPSHYRKGMPSRRVVNVR